jgi:hypothetical protein
MARGKHIHDQCKYLSLGLEKDGIEHRRCINTPWPLEADLFLFEHPEENVHEKS